MEKSAEELYNERLTRLKTTISLREPDSVPIWFPADTWVAHYSGYNIQEILYDYEKLIGAINKVLLDFDWDAVFPPFGTWPAPVLDAIGQRTLMISGQDVSTTSSFQFPDASPMQAEDYPEFIADPYAFIVEKLLPRRATELAKPFPRNELALAKGAVLFGMYLARLGTQFGEWKEVYGAPLAVLGFTKAPMDMIEDQMRGFKGMIMDIKRRPEQVKAACEAMLPLAVKLAKAGYGGPPADYPPLFIPLHIAEFLRPVDFEEFYWPTFSKLIKELAEAGFSCLIYCEGNWDPYLDFLAQLPKGKVIALLESTNMKKAKAVLGNTMCIAGNIHNSLLGYGTEEECVAYAKELIDTCAPGGGFIFSCDKVMLTPNDAKPENLQAVTKFVREYGVYKK
jgi:hypothetical protein